MYQAIVLLPLLGAHNRFPGEDPPPPAGHHAAPPGREDHPRAAPVPHGAHAASAATHVEELEHAPSAAGSLLAELTTSTFLVICCVISWFALFDVGFAGHEARIPTFSFVSFADLHSESMLRIDTLTAVML